MLKQIIRQWVDPLVDITKIVKGIPAYVNYARQWRRYRNLPGAESLCLSDVYPCLFDNCPIIPVDGHYFYQAVWALAHIAKDRSHQHVDIGSQLVFVGFLTSITKVLHIDIRTPAVTVRGLKFINGSILDLPFAGESIASLSCLHVVEHIGLGRYGDQLDPLGTQKAIQELTRVLAPGGNLYFSVPVGRPRTCFNAHRIYAPEKIFDLFAPLELVQFCGVDDSGKYWENVDPKVLAHQHYGCGFYWFRKN
jgi:SAM-dependent methyltransferase